MLDPLLLLVWLALVVVGPGMVILQPYKYEGWQHWQVALVYVKSLYQDSIETG
jgi:hypothetical protein